MARRDSYIEHLAQVPLFSACSQDELRKLSRRTTDIPIAAGHTLVKEGERGLEFFVIVSGRAKVSRKGRKVGELGPGDFFGELAALDWGADYHYPRLATVVAATDLRLAKVSAATLRSLMGAVPAIDEEVRRVAAERLAVS
jgi:CRP-like cAMP-binding protein